MLVTIPASCATLIVCANPYRRMLTIQNVGTCDLYISHCKDVTTTCYAHKLAAGQTLQVPDCRKFFGIATAEAKVAVLCS